MPRTEHEPLVAVLGTRDNCDGSVTSREANGSVSCLPAGVLSDGIAPSKSPNWKKSGMRLTMVLFVSWFNLVLQGIAPCLILFILQHNGYRVFSTPWNNSYSWPIPILYQWRECLALGVVEGRVGVRRERRLLNGKYFYASEWLFEAIAKRN